MSEKFITPKFLTKEIASIAVSHIILMVNNGLIANYIKRQICHIVVMVESMKDGSSTDYADYPDYPLKPTILFEESIGDIAKWTAKYDAVARCKALQLWHGRNDGRPDIVPHRLFSGDAPIWGGVRREGIVVACAGIQPWFDQMFAGIVADIIVALARDAWEKSYDKEKKVDWLT